ncbi:A24 family peptidase [Gemmatimonas phototrophica]|uniref:A24 family peptidase n=1 Tax=Gemmatimonas phototrophica TaxID=1379270 RepID=UPI0006A6EC15|nr:prepilin peptidase [Gemmatimonas phototrophica]
MISDVRVAAEGMVLGALLCAAAISDVRERRVTNGLNLIILLIGFVVSTLQVGLWSGVGHALSGVGVALLIWFPMFALRLMGAGDVKLIAAASTWLGWQGAIVATLATGVAGGVLGALWLVRSDGALSALHTVGTALRSPWLMKMRPFEPRERIPYAVAIATGVATAWWFVNGQQLLGGR